jgi:hypothetical protein
LRKGELAAWSYRVSHHVAAETVRKRMRRSAREQVYAENEAIRINATNFLLMASGAAPIFNDHAGNVREVSTVQRCHDQ